MLANHDYLLNNYVFIANFKVKRNLVIFNKDNDQRYSLNLNYALLPFLYSCIDLQYVKLVNS